MIPFRSIMAAPFRFGGAIWRASAFLLAGRPVIAPEFVRRDRMAYCRGCEHNENGVCAVCTCLIDAKVFLSSEQCPDTPPRWKSLV